MTNPVFPPNPRETIAPTDTIDAFGTVLVGLIDEMPRDVIKGHLEEMDINAVVFTAQGIPTPIGSDVAADRALNPVERQFIDTIQWCFSQSLLSTPLEAVTGLAIVRNMVEDGGVFVGRELPYEHYNRPQ